MDRKIHNSAAVARVYDQFYRIPRVGQLTLSDGGGPFGFDISLALEVDWIIGSYSCDGIVESGCHLGDTTEYLARCYPTTPLTACDTEETYIAVCRHRLQEMANPEVVLANSRDWIGEACRGFRLPFVYLDAHGGVDWPLSQELSQIRRGIVCVHDFDIGHKRFGFDTYSGTVCNSDLLRQCGIDLSSCFVNDPTAIYPLPCLQVGRRSGRVFIPIGVTSVYLRQCPYLNPLG